MPSDDLQRTTLARAKRLALLGALVLWVVSPFAIGGWIALAVHQADRHTSASMYALLVVWAVVDLVLLIAGFALLLGGVFLWWRSHNPSRVTTARSAGGSSARQDLLRQLREELRDDAQATPHRAEGESASAAGNTADSEPSGTPR